MATMSQRLTDIYDQAMAQADPLVKSWPLMSSPLPMLVLSGVYLFLVWQGPKWMMNRKPLELRNVLLIYNFGLVLLSTYMFYEFMASVLMIPGFDFICQPIIVSKADCPGRLGLQSVMWFYHISKGVEFLETVFFILRKKNNQVSFLHCYHHVSMFIYTWIIVSLAPGGSFYFAGAFNCLVHMFMYGYYLLAAMGPELRPYLWWKKYLTSFQLIQFVAIVIHSALAIRADCGMPKFLLWFHMLYMVSFIILFGQFYIRNYINRSIAMKRFKME